MLVMKFGGTSEGTGERIAGVEELVSETNLTFVVQAADAPEAVRRLHRELFEKEAA